MGFSWWTFALQAANFAVLVWLLHRFLYRPVLRVIAERKAQIEGEYQQCDAVKAQAQAQLASASAERERTSTERDALLKAAAVQAEQRAAAQRAEASRQATELLDEAHKTLAAERTAALAEARGIAIDLAADITRRLIGEIPVELRAQAWLQKVEQHLGALEADQREALTLAISAKSPLRVVSALALPEASQTLWRERLQRVLGKEVAIEFTSNPALIAGVELHFPGAIVHFTWQAALETLRSQLSAVQAQAHVESA